MSYNADVATQRAIATLNALISGGQFQSLISQDEEGKPKLDEETLREIELQLRGYYSEWPHPAPRPRPEQA